MKRNGCVCNMKSNNGKEKNVEKSYPGRAHWAVVKLKWQIVQIKNGIKHSYGYSIWINLSWTTGKTGGNT